MKLGSYWTITATILFFILLFNPLVAKPVFAESHPTEIAQPTTTDNRSPVFSVGAYGDSTLGFIAEAKFASYISYHQRDALAIEFNGGPNVFRTNATYGLGLTDQQRVKLTFEHLQQDLDFDFSAGAISQTVSQWVNQEAIGGAYAYLPNTRFVDALEVGGYFAHAPSKTLSDTSAFDTSKSRFTDIHRRIAGSNAGNVYADVALRLWPHSRFSGGIDYDNVHFDTTYDNDRNVHGIGGHLQLEQRLLPQLRTKLRTRLQHTQFEYMASIGWLIPSPKGMQLELEATTDYVDSRATPHNFFTNGARLNVAFESLGTVYNELDQQHESLLDWTRTPAVRMATVLAVADLGIKQDYIRPLTLSEISANGTNGNATSFNFGGWTARSGTNNAFDFNGSITFLLASYRSNTATIFYRSSGAFLILQRTDVGGVIGTTWDPPGSSVTAAQATALAAAGQSAATQNTCSGLAHSPEECHYQPA